MRSVAPPPAVLPGTAGRTFRLLLLLVLGFFTPSAADSYDTIVANVVLNGVGKGEYFVKLGPEGDFLVRGDDLGAMGFRAPAGKETWIDGDRYLSLKSLEGVRFAFDGKSITLEITASPALLPVRTFDLTPQQSGNVSYPKDTGGFLNYGLNFTGGNSSSIRSFEMANQAGIRKGDFLLLSDFSYRKTDAEEKFVRLMSSATYDRRDRLDRLVVGDQFASSGDLGSSLNLGGVGYSKIYRMDPYFLRYPLANVSGLVSLPSEAEIYLNGTRIRTERLSPGGFDLKNISYYGGASVLSVEIKDPFGREQRLAYPFYFTDILLRKGLHEYSYNIGFQREDFGVASDMYGRMAFSAFHNYGVSDSLTAGFRAEGTPEKANLGPQASILIPEAGIASLSVSGSVKEGGDGGLAGVFSHDYQNRRINTRIFLRGFSRNYATAGEESVQDRIRREIGAGIGYGGTREFGSLSLDFDSTKKYQGTDRQTGTVTYTRSLAKSCTLTVTVKNVREQSVSNEFFAGLTYYAGKDLTLSAGFRREGDANTETVQAQKNPPAGEGIGYRATAERTDSPSAGGTTVNPSVQYNARYGIYSGEYRGEFRNGGEKTETLRLSASGAVAFAGNAFGFSRPITDSFGIVQVGDLEGVRVYQSNQEIGRTDRKGRILLPELGSYYNNRISINDKDIPIEYAIAEMEKFVSPPLRSGTFIPFEVKKFQAFTGTLKIMLDGTAKTVEYQEVRLFVQGKEIVFPTGRGGEFYLENIPPGSYPASFAFRGESCRFELAIPASNELIVNLGDAICEIVP